MTIQNKLITNESDSIVCVFSGSAFEEISARPVFVTVAVLSTQGHNNTDQTHLINNWNVKFVLSCFVAPKQVEVLIIMLVSVESTGLWLHACTCRVIAR